MFEIKFKILMIKEIEKNKVDKAVDLFSVNCIYLFMIFL